jgi:chromate transporter
MASLGRFALNDHPLEHASLTSAGEVFWVALGLGMTSFGGPIAHLGYFERAYVQRRRWLSAEQYGAYVSLCQSLPGPTSSQVGFLVGLHRAGWLGALAAWTGFTLPSALLMYGFAMLAPAAAGPRMQAVLHGLMLAAVIVVAQAVGSMARRLCPDLPRAMIALGAAAVLILRHSSVAQLACLSGGAIAGALVCRRVALKPSYPLENLTASVRWFSPAVFGILLTASVIIGLRPEHGPIELAAIFYRAGALVFGGGHVVLPLLQQALVPDGWTSNDRFLAGYGFAQAMPGPLFTFAVYLGAASKLSEGALAGSLIALAAIFLPGLLLAAWGASMWARVAGMHTAQAALAGTNAAVVGVLASALYAPVWTTAVRGPRDVVAVLLGFALLQWCRVPPILLVVLYRGISRVRTRQNCRLGVSY